MRRLQCGIAFTFCFDRCLALHTRQRLRKYLGHQHFNSVSASVCISASDSILLNVLPTVSAFISASVGPAFRLLMRSSFPPFTSTCLWEKALACKSGNMSFGFSASSFASLLFRALTYTSHTFLPKLIGYNRFLRVDQLIQQCLDFHFVLFVSKCLGVYLLLPGHSARRPGSLSSYHSVSRTVFSAFTSPGVFSTILDEN